MLKSNVHCQKALTSTFYTTAPNNCISSAPSKARKVKILSLTTEYINQIWSRDTIDFESKNIA